MINNKATKTAICLCRTFTNVNWVCVLVKKNRSIAFDREVNVAWASNCMNYMIEKEGN